MSEITEIINSVGFPMAMCVAFGWYINKKDTQRLEAEKESRHNEIEERKKLIESIELYRQTSTKLLETNKEVSETNRMLVNELSIKMNNVENSLLEINHKIS